MAREGKLLEDQRGLFIAYNEVGEGPSPAKEHASAATSCAIFPDEEMKTSSL